MTSDKYAMSEKILQDVSNVLEKNIYLNEFEIVPMPSSQNKSPVLSAGNCLALESWCIKYLYCYVYDIIMNTRKQKKKFIFDDSLLKQLNCALLLNPDVTTFWNMRRQFVEKNLITINDELKFSRLVLSRKHKCNDAFGYRRWLLSKDEMTLPTLNRELEISQICADRSACNCHAWTHRIWAMQKYLNAPTSLSISSIDRFSILIKELQFSENWTSLHVSDFSGFHYREFLLDTIRCDKFILCENFLSTDHCLKGLETLNDFLASNNEEKLEMYNLNGGNILYHLFNYKPYNSDENFENRMVFLTMLLIYDLSYCQQLSETFSYHESIFCHRRYVLHTLFNLDKEFNSVKNNVKQDLNKMYTQQQCNGNIVKSLDVDHLFINSPKKTKHEYNFDRLLKAVINHEKRYVNDTKYLKWCQFILHVPMG